MDRKINAFLRVFAAYFIWSFLGVIFQTSSFTIFQNIFIFSALTCIYILVIPFLSKKLTPIKSYKWNLDLWLFIIASGLSGVLWFTGLSMIPIAPAILLYATVPLFAFILEIILLKENSSVLRLLILFVGLVGIAIILSQSLVLHITYKFFLGATLVLLGAFLNALQGIYNKKITIIYSPITIVLFIMLAQAVVSLPFIFFHVWQINLYSVITTLFISIFATLVGYFLFVSAFSMLRTSTIMVLGYLDPVFSSTWAYIFLKQPLTVAVFLGGILILFSGYYMVRLEQK